jgi:starch synthase
LKHVQNNQVPLVYNLHNLNYSKGLKPHAFRLLTRERDERLYRWEGMEFYGSIDPHKTSFIFSDRIVTVSPNYANEILSDLTPGGNTNLYAGILQANQSKLRGILNGIPDNYGVDHFHQTGVLPESYGPDNLEGKKACRRYLQEVAELEPYDQSMLLASTGRWDEQKGTDLVLKVLPELMQELDLQFISIGSEARGKKFRKEFLGLKNRFPKRLAVLDFTAMPRPHLSAENLESLALAGADALIMPSRFEPCGLSQIYSLKHGTPVIANRTGGLADTVEHGKTGFLFEGVTPENIEQSIRDAYAIFRGDPQKWQSMIQAALKKNFSWKSAVQKYIDLYQEIIQS